MLLTMNAALAPSALCAGPEWVQLDENADSGFFYDRSATRKTDEGNFRVQTRVVYTEQGKADALKMLSSSKDLGKLYESRYVHDLNCPEKESRLLNAAHLDKDGVVLKSTDLSSFTEWEAIPPDVRMFSVLQEACSQ
ncbi:MAG: hypothetical protein A2075_19660 [Geobacteraceae bacterium GWC2_58_44]|nr:MAG: hypothetical protein A2075_19660 [Geobacteraceae bacterium GWC2_58_44]